MYVRVCGCKAIIMLFRTSSIGQTSSLGEVPEIFEASPPKSEAAVEEARHLGCSQGGAQKREHDGTAALQGLWRVQLFHEL